MNIHQVLAELELLSHGSTTSWNPSAHSSDEDIGGKQPPGESNPPHLYWAEAWARAITNRRRDAVLAAAIAELQATKRRTPVTAVNETPMQLDARIVRDGKGWAADQVARSLRITVTRVRKARLAAGLNITTGKPVQITATDATNQAIELAKSGMTIRQIEMITRLPRSTVHRLIRKAA